MSTPFPIPLNALRAIEIVSRTRSLAPAAKELGVTPGAVSQHLRRAEARLGVQLFARTSSGLVPTAALVAVQPMLRTGFQALADASAALRQRQDNVLTITVGNVFASRWLVWRLNRFYSRAPEIELRIVTTGKLVDLARPDIDCGVRFGNGAWPELRAELLGGRAYMPVCTPELADRLKVPTDLSNVPIIDDPAGMLLWENWFDGAGFTMPAGLKGPRYTDPSIAFDAAQAGQGVLLTTDMMVADGLALGCFVKPFAHQEPSEFGYWFVTDAQTSRPRKVQIFLDWMRSEINAVPV